MYQKFKTDILSSLSDVDSNMLQKVIQALDLVGSKYTIREINPDPVAIGREQFMETVNAYLVTRRTEGVAQGSLSQMTRTLTNFVNAMIKPIEQIRANDIRNYLYQYQAARGITNQSLNFLRSIICTFFKWAAADGIIPCDPTANIRPIRYYATPRKALTQFELERVRRACKTERETCILEVLYSTGCRVSELCGIKLADVDFERREIQVLGKGGKYRNVFINAKALISIQAYLQNRSHVSPFLICNDRGGGQLTRSNVEKIFRRIENETNITVSPHIMRHTMATQALTGTGVEVVQQMLGHSNVATTMIYAEVDSRNLRAAHDRCVI